MKPQRGTETGEITVDRGEFASVLDGKGRQVRICHQARFDIRKGAEFTEEMPVSLAGIDRNTVATIADRGCELQCLRHRRRGRENPVMGDDADETTQDHVRHTERLARLEYMLQPLPILEVLVEVLTMSADEEVDVGQDQSVGSSARSFNSAKLS